MKGSWRYSVTHDRCENVLSPWIRNCYFSYSMIFSNSSGRWLGISACWLLSKNLNKIPPASTKINMKFDRLNDTGLVRECNTVYSRGGSSPYFILYLSYLLSYVREVKKCEHISFNFFCKFFLINSWEVVSSPSISLARDLNRSVVNSDVWGREIYRNFLWFKASQRINIVDERYIDLHSHISMKMILPLKLSRSLITTHVQKRGYFV